MGGSTDSKTWQEALVLAEAVRVGVPRGEPLPIAFSYVGAARWFGEFAEQQHRAAAEHTRLADPTQTARTLAIVQARCTELLLEVRALRKKAVDP